MKRHPLDLISAVLGVIVTVLAVAVMLQQAPGLVAGGAWWLAIAALLIGLALIPWRRTGPTDDNTSAPVRLPSDG